METLKDKFHQYPNKDPKTGKSIEINGPEFKKLVTKYGQPKIKSPITSSKIGVGKGEYKNLIKSGYTEQDLLYPVKQTQIPDDNILEILLNADLNTIKNMCLTNKKLQQRCTTEQFWQQKLKHDGLPSIIFDETRNMERISDSVEVGLGYGLHFWITLYNIMKKAQEEAKGIVLINKIEQNKGFSNSGTIKILLHEAYANEEQKGVDIVKAILPNIKVDFDYPSVIEFKLLKDKNYKFGYAGYNDNTTLTTVTKMIDEDEVIRIMTLFLFDYYTIIGEFDIADVKGSSLMDQRGIDYRRGMWDMIHYKQH